MGQVFKSVCQSQFIGTLFHVQVTAKEEKSLHILQFQLQKVIFLDLCGYLEILKILPGPAKAFNAVRFQTPSRPSLSILALHGCHLRHLRMFGCMSHQSPRLPCLNHEVTEQKTNPFLKSLQEEDISVNFSSLPAAKNSSVPCALPMNASCGAPLNDSPF